MRKLRIILPVAFLAAVVGVYACAQSKLPKPQSEFHAGAQAPDFTLKDQDGIPVTLSKLQGGPVLLVFYRGYW